MKHTLDREMLRSVFLIQNPSRNRWCNDQAINTIKSLAPAGCTVVRYRGNLLIRKGPASGPHPYYLAHMDQVHDYEPGMYLTVKGNTLFAYDGNRRQTGVGGDDKCGIYLALEMLHTLDHVTAVFVRDEEVGCEGSGEVPLSWFDHAAFVLQADRNNRTMDVIRSTNGVVCASDAFMDAILALPTAKKHGHRPAEGSVTDIGELANRELCVSMVNISSGYHHPHSEREVVHLDELAVACQLALEAGRSMGGIKWEHVPTSSWVRDREWSWEDFVHSPRAKATAMEWDEDPMVADDEIEDFINDKTSLIKELVTFHGYDEGLHNLNAMTTCQLSNLLQDAELAAHLKALK